MKKILIADDNDETREYISQTLTFAGYAVIEAEDGKKVLEKVSIEKPDLIILDMSMPGLDGYDVTLKLKGNADTKHIPIIIASAHGKLQDLFQLDKQTKIIEGFIEKPFMPDQLVNKIKQLLK